MCRHEANQGAERMPVIQVGLVDKTGLDPHLLQDTADALNVQVMRDLLQFWNVTATVRYLPDPDRIPVGTWPVYLVPKLPPGEGGVHLDKHNQPYSLVIGTPGNNDWTIDASHETVEMLVDPAGNRLQASRAITIAGKGVQDTAGEFQYLIEACDPCEANEFAYSINGIAVSDFITPHFYDPVTTSGTRYSFCGHITAPRQLLKGGYISFVDPQADEVKQILWLNATPVERTLGRANGLSLRAFVDNKTYKLVADARQPNPRLTAWNQAHRERLEAVVKARAAAATSQGD
jgi:hypothetical protein